MTLDEDGSVLRWYKSENRTGFDGQLYMRYCAEISDPKEGLFTTWPENAAEGTRFVVCSPYRAFYLVAENEAEKK